MWNRLNHGFTTNWTQKIINKNNLLVKLLKTILWLLFLEYINIFVQFIFLVKTKRMMIFFDYLKKIQIKLKFWREKFFDTWHQKLNHVGNIGEMTSVTKITEEMMYIMINVKIKLIKKMN